MLFSIKKIGWLILWVCCFSTVSYAKKSHKHKVKQVILLIGDGMGAAQVYAAMSTQTAPLHIERCTSIGFSKTYSADNYITDSAAGGTAIATGVKTKNGAIGVDTLGQPLVSILHYAEKNNYATGLVATSAITHATPASFVAHVASRSSYEDIALDFLKTDVDVFFGGGYDFFAHRKDSLNLLDSLYSRHYTLIRDVADIPSLTSEKVAGLFAKDGMLKMEEGRGNYLPTATKKALELLSSNKNGFFLMVEGSQIDWAGHDNNPDYLIAEMHDFDKAVGEAMAFADAHPGTLVIVTADHETGGLALNQKDKVTGKIKAAYSTTNHTGVMVPVYAYGTGAEKFSGIYQNTALFDKMLAAFGFTR